MLTSFKEKGSEWVCKVVRVLPLNLSEFSGVVTDIDGLANDSEPWIQKSIIESAWSSYARAPEGKIPKNILEKFQNTFGQADDKMSRDLYDVMRANAEFDEAKLDQITRDQFPNAFADSRTATWKQYLESGTVKQKPGFLELMDIFRQQQYFIAIYNSMPREIAKLNRRALGLDDQVYDTQLVSCDDVRLLGDEGFVLGKPHSRGWEVLAKVALDCRGIEFSRLIAIEDRASGAIGALRAGYGKVIVVPDPNDNNRIDDSRHLDLGIWDKKGLIREYLSLHPEATRRIQIVDSLNQIHCTN